MESESTLTPRGKKKTSTGKILSRGGSNPLRYIKQDSEASTLPTSYLPPPPPPSLPVPSLVMKTNLQPLLSPPWPTLVIRFYSVWVVKELVPSRPPQKVLTPQRRQIKNTASETLSPPTPSVATPSPDVGQTNELSLWESPKDGTSQTTPKCNGSHQTIFFSIG